MSMLGTIFPLILLTITCAQEGKECSSPLSDPAEELIGKRLQSYPHNTLLKYSCRPGYIKLGTIYYLCENGSWKNINHVKCRKKSCGHPGDAQFGTFRLTEGEDFVFGARVEYSCDDGYHMVSQRTFRVCMADGWSNDIPHCEVTTCEPVRQPEHGKIIMSSLYEVDQEVPFGNVVQFECDAHYKITGEKEIHCKQDGTWSAAVPKCEPISCEVPAILHGTPLPGKRSFKENDELEYKCDTGYKRGSIATVTCTKLGWSPRPECTGITCSPQTLLYGSYVNEKSVYQYGEEIRYQCLTDFLTVDNKNEGRATCDTDGWSPEVRCLGRPCVLPETASGHIAEQFILYRDYYFKIGRRVEFICNDGYETKWGSYYNTFTITCTLEGWKPTPVCLKICEFLQIQNVKNVRKTKYKENEQARYDCEYSYFTPQKASKGTAKCLSSGWSVEPSCKKPCTFPDVINAKIDSLKSLKEKFDLDDELPYQCDKGYTTDYGMPNGKTKCLIDGWIPEPKCTISEVRCEKPSIEHGQSKMNNGLVEFSCNSGYALHGPKISQCHHIGWHPLPPVCQEHTCGIPPEIKFGMYIREKDSYNVGENVTYSCYENYTIYGKETITCTSEGWSSAPSCENSTMKCEHPSGVEVLSKAKEEYEYGSTIIYKCISPFLNMEFNRSTCIGGKWTPDIRCIDPTKKCEVPTDTYTAKIRQVSKEDYLHSSSVIYECKQGLFPSEEKREKRFCIDGNWTALPECRWKTCPPPPPELPNSEIQNSSAEYYHLQRIEYKCKPNYELEGPQVVTCNKGKWTPLPKCVYKKCLEPPSIGDGKYFPRNNKYDSGDEVEYHCDEGYNLIGSAKVRCEYGKWSPVPECKARKCEQPENITNGRFAPKLSSYESGTNVTYSCNGKYILKGAAEVTCVLGKWEDTPYCTAEGQECGEPPRINNGDIGGIIQPPYKDGLFIKYQCFTKYKLQGNADVQCLNGAWTTPPTCLEACTAAVEIMKQNNLELRWEQTQKLYAEHDEFIEFQCKYSYKPVHGSEMRLQCKNGKLNYPKCISGSREYS